MDEENRELAKLPVATAILNLHCGAVAGISVSGPAQRLTPDQIAGIGTMVSVAAARIGAVMPQR